MIKFYVLQFFRRGLLLSSLLFFCIFVSSLISAGPFTASLKIQPSPKSPAPVNETITFSVVGETEGDPANSNNEEYSTNLRWVLNSTNVAYSGTRNGTSSGSGLPTHTFTVSPGVNAETTGGSWSCSFKSATAGYWSFSFSATAKMDIYKLKNGQPTNEYIRTDSVATSCITLTILVSVDIIVQGLGENQEDNPGAFIGIEDYDTASLSYSPGDLNVGTLILSATNLKVTDVSVVGPWNSQISWNLANETPPGTVWFLADNESGTGSLKFKHSCDAVDTVKVTTVDVEITKVEEKPWGMSWSNAEDSGSYQIGGKERKWYFLWTTDEHKYTAEIKPSSANNYVSSVSFDFLGNATKGTDGKWTIPVLILLLAIILE
jgi:hypothetical protein